MAEETRDEREQAVEAFAAVATPEEKAKVGVVEDSVVSVVAAAESLQVRNAAEAEQAAGVLARIAGEKKRAEEARTFLVRPLNEHVKAINERFRGPRQMLERADNIIRRKVIAFQQEQERRREEEQARLDAERRVREEEAEQERRRAEAKAREEREAAAREAARAEAEARAAERRRQEEIAAHASELERQAAQMDDEHLRRHAGAATEISQIAQRRETARRAQEEAAAARQREEEARAREAEERSRPLPERPRATVAPAGPIRSGRSSASQRKVWKATSIDVARLPAEYLMPNEKAINGAIRRGVRMIPGVTIEQVPELSVRAH
jgi:hypothetical protein